MPVDIDAPSTPRPLPYLKELTGLRGLAAAFVLLNHSLTILPPSTIGGLLAKGYSAKLFMIVSGFSICWLLDTEKSSYGRFVIRRAFRIFPVYLLGLLVSTLMLDFVRRTLTDLPPCPANGFALEIIEAQRQLAAHLAAHATLLHGILPDSLLPHASSSIIGQAWSLSVEWQLYLLAPLAIGWLTTLGRRSSQVWLLGLLACLLLCGRYLSIGFIGNNLAMFSLGFVSYDLVRRFRDDQGALAASMAAILGVSMIWDPGVVPAVVVWTAAVYSATILRPGRFATVTSQCLRSRFAQHLGRISYSFYIFHMVAMYSCLRVIDRVGTPISLRYIALPLASFALTMVIAEFAYRLIEQPCYHFGKTLTARPAVAPWVQPAARERAA